MAETFFRCIENTRAGHNVPFSTRLYQCVDDVFLFFRGDYRESVHFSIISQGVIDSSARNPVPALNSTRGGNINLIGIGGGGGERSDSGIGSWN